jgi:hypothetical protein
VSFVRRSHQQQKLSRKLQAYSETRFADAIIMLDVFREVSFEVYETLVNCTTMFDYNSIEKKLLDDICSFLKPFQQVIDDLSVNQEPSLHRVIPLRQYLINRCKVEENDSLAIDQLKTFLGEKEILFIPSRHLL